MLQETLQPPRFQKPILENSIWYNGNTFSFLLDAKQTAGAFALIHCYFTKGGGPPAHFHRNEDETFYILEGEIRFHIGDNEFIIDGLNFITTYDVTIIISKNPQF